MTVRRPHAAAADAETAARPAAPPASGRRRAWQVGWVLLVAAALFAVWSGWSYWQTDHGGTLAAGQLRDQVLHAATQEITDLNTVNDRQIGASETRWLADTTGAEHAQVQRTADAARAQILLVKTSSRALVTAAAVTRLNQQAGTAQVMTVVRVKQTADSGGEDTVSNRYLVGLARTTAGWKISSISPG